MKVIALDAHHLEIMQSVCAHVGGSLQPVLVLRLIGSLETLLAVGIISGLFHRFVNFFQIGVLLLMNVVGAASAGGAIPHPLGLIISNLPTMMCALIIAIRGPGSWALALHRPGEPKAFNDVRH